MAEIVEAYLADKDKTAIRAVDLRGSWKQAKPTFGHLRPDQITRDVCRAYRDERYAAGRKPATVRKELEVVRAGLNFFKKGAVAVFELPPQPPAKDRFLDKAEARALLKAARRFSHVRAFIALSLATGARQSALLELTWDRVDFKRRTISLALNDAKDDQRKKRATVPMTGRAYRYLRVLHEGRTCNHVIEWGGHRVLSIKKGFSAAAKRAGLDGITPHILRHTAASWMAEADVPMFDISRYLGHSDTRVTERRYAKLSPSHLRRAAKALEW
ncbi:MAG: site-specific integrase [Brevundimonas sp.]|uniref:tyrosine-type recombinase/integrase n=1 Tax=Brevundimonas sp. TaxID=1871086 RepID=UPI00258E2C12|nr:site-specific integrase [Brevundimonas sp.]MCV0413479.1 site-specific integrase [Brevundimonas sp.]